MFSVDTEQEAQELIGRCCEQVWVHDGPGGSPRLGYVANELEQVQSIDNLNAFGDRLEEEYKRMKSESA